MLSGVNTPIDAGQNSGVVALKAEVAQIYNGRAWHEGFLAGERGVAKAKFACGTRRGH